MRACSGPAGPSSWVHQPACNIPGRPTRCQLHWRALLSEVVLQAIHRNINHQGSACRQYEVMPCCKHCMTLHYMISAAHTVACSFPERCTPLCDALHRSNQLLCRNIKVRGWWLHSYPEYYTATQLEVTTLQAECCSTL
jgi:hypothetical protein